MFGYNIYRADRNSKNNSTHNKGGGVLIAVHKRILSRLLPSYDLSCEQLSVLVIFNDTTIILHSCYIPPNSSSEMYNSHCISIENIFTNHPDSTFIIAGDFNLPGIEWENSDAHAIISGLRGLQSIVF